MFGQLAQRGRRSREGRWGCAWDGGLKEKRLGSSFKLIGTGQGPGAKVESAGCQKAALCRPSLWLRAVSARDRVWGQTTGPVDANKMKSNRGLYNA